MLRLSPERKRLFGERLREACVVRYGKEHGIATRLAEDMDITVQTASKWMRGRVTPEPDRWGELANLLGVSAAWLTGASHEMPSVLSGSVEQASVELAGQAAQIVFPLVLRLKPDISQKEIDELVQGAYYQLRAGREASAISGEVAAKLL